MTLPVIAVLLMCTATPQVDFDTEVMPILSKAGCNSAACHGSSAGQAGFRLSLFGGDPAADYLAIAHALKGRRIHRSRPELSLFIAKPTEAVEHGGGLALEDPSMQQTLFRWIQQGAPRLRARKLERLHVFPLEITSSVSDQPIQLSVIASYSDGHRRDVTKLALYTSRDPFAVNVTTKGEVTVHRPGLHYLLLQLDAQVIPVRVLAYDQGKSIPSSNGSSHWIDREINDVLQSVRCEALPTVDDAGFIRRVSLDLTGRLPEIEDVEAYVNSRLLTKRNRLIDRLLASDDYHRFWSCRWNQLLHPERSGVEREAVQAFKSWIESQVAGDASWSDMARDMLIAEGDSHEVGAASFHRLFRDAREEGESVAELFCGLQLRCANCHRHPFDRWTQSDYHGFAQLFAPIERSRFVSFKGKGSIINPQTQELAIPSIPGYVIEQNANAMQSLGTWCGDPENSFFARVMVNRIWGALFGRGLIEPVDDLRDSNPATHPELLKKLAIDFRSHEMRLKPLLRTICLSEVYARQSSRSTSFDVTYRSTMSRPMEAYVVQQAVADMTGVPVLPIDQVMEPIQGLNPCARERSCAWGEPAGTGLQVKLQMLNSSWINAALRHPGGWIKQRVAKGDSALQILEACLLRARGQRFSEEERAHWQSYFDHLSDEETDNALEDAVWGLLNSESFLTNH